MSPVFPTPIHTDVSSAKIKLNKCAKRYHRGRPLVGTGGSGGAGPAGTSAGVGAGVGAGGTPQLSDKDSVLREAVNRLHVDRKIDNVNSKFVFFQRNRVTSSTFLLPLSFFNFTTKALN